MYTPVYAPLYTSGYTSMLPSTSTRYPLRDSSDGYAALEHALTEQTVTDGRVTVRVTNTRFTVG